MGREKLVIIGTGGLGRETLWSALRAQAAGGAEVLGFVTSERAQHGTELCGAPVLGGDEWLVGHSELRAVCAIGDPRARRRLAVSLEERGVRFTRVVDPSALHSEFVELGLGCIVGARAVLTTQVRVGKHAVIGVGCVVSHDVALEDFATLAPGVVLAGSVHVELGADLGAGASVIPGRRIGRGAVVGAQTAVVEDIEPNTVVAGVPARMLRRLPPEQAL